MMSNKKVKTGLDGKRYYKEDTWYELIQNNEGKFVKSPLYHELKEHKVIFPSHMWNTKEPLDNEDKQYVLVDVSYYHEELSLIDSLVQKINNYYQTVSKESKHDDGVYISTAVFLSNIIHRILDMGYVEAMEILDYSYWKNEVDEYIEEWETS